MPKRPAVNVLRHIRTDNIPSQFHWTAQDGVSAAMSSAAHVHPLRIRPRRADTMAMPISVSNSARKAWTISDLERLPEDGNRYEILHGELLVTPLPSTGSA